MVETRKARDLKLLDAVDAMPREPFEGRTWRVVREGRDPVVGSPSQSRWCNGQFDVLYTSLARDGAIAEIHTLLSMQPVFPSRVTWYCYELNVRVHKSARLSDLVALSELGVNVNSYQDRQYVQTQAIADAAFFLGFDAIYVPSARWTCANLVLFTEHIQPEQIEPVSGTDTKVDWIEWRKSNR